MLATNANSAEVKKPEPPSGSSLSYKCAVTMLAFTFSHSCDYTVTSLTEQFGRGRSASFFSLTLRGGGCGSQSRSKNLRLIDHLHLPLCKESGLKMQKGTSPTLPITTATTLGSTATDG
jgi:hypothetical protein